MEEVIKENFCKYCINHKKNCIKIQIITKKDIKIYKCVNYRQKDKK